MVVCFSGLDPVSDSDWTEEEPVWSSDGESTGPLDFFKRV